MSGGPPFSDGESLLDEAFVRRLEGLRLRARRLSGTAVGGRPGRQRTPAADFIDHRAYSPGDDLRHVDWFAMARHDTVTVKVGRRPQATRVDLLVDTSRSMALIPRKARLAAQLAAALGWLSLTAGDRVRLEAFPGAPKTWGPGVGAGATPSFLRTVSQIGFGGDGASALEPAVQALSRGNPAGGLAVVISDFWLTDDLDVALAHLPGPRWDVLLLHLLDPDEMTPPPVGGAEVEDVETGETVQVNITPALQAEFRAAMGMRLERLRQVAGRAGATYAFIPTDWPLEQAVLAYLQRRSILAE